MKWVIGLVVGWVALAAVARAERASGVTPMVLARATYPEFKVKANDDNLEFKAKAGTPMDIVVRQHNYDAGGRTGWHRHPGPVFITVLDGILEVYEFDDKTCTPMTLVKGQGYVDDGQGHLIVNRNGPNTAIDLSVITAPAGGAFRTDIDIEKEVPPCNP